MSNLQFLANIRLATTEAGLSKGYLIFSWGLPPPSLPVYADHSAKVALSNGGQAIRGYTSFSLTWDRGVLSNQQAWVLRDLVEAALATGGKQLFATVDYGWNSTNAPGHWVDLKGEPHLGDFTPVGNTGGLLKDQVTLFVNNLTEVNNPASF